MQVQPYLFFDGTCEQAVEFYRKAIDAQVDMLMRWKDNPDPGMCPPGMEEKIIHTSFRVGDTMVMASDGPDTKPKDFRGFSLSLSVADEAEADKRFAALAEGGSVQMRLEKTFFSPRFGMLTDRFGVSWMVIVNPEQK